MLRKTTMAAAMVTAGLAVPAAAQAHVSLHPNVVPAGAFATLNIRVPNEMDNANVTKIAVQLPPGFTDVPAAPPPGWSYSTKTQKLATPIQTDDGPVDTEVTEIDFTGGKIPIGQFQQFPISVVIPGKAGDVLTFKTVQTYSNGKTVSWIGPPSSETPAPTIDVTAKGGYLQDFAGGEAGPPAKVPSSGTTVATANVTRVVKQSSSGASKGLGIAALVVAIIALILGGVALTRRKPAAAA